MALFRVDGVWREGGRLGCGFAFRDWSYACRVVRTRVLETCSLIQYCSYLLMANSHRLLSYDAGIAIHVSRPQNKTKTSDA